MRQLLSERLDRGRSSLVPLRIGLPARGTDVLHETKGQRPPRMRSEADQSRKRREQKHPTDHAGRPTGPRLLRRGTRAPSSIAGVVVDLDVGLCGRLGRNERRKSRGSRGTERWGRCALAPRRGPVELAALVLLVEDCVEPVEGISHRSLAAVDEREDVPGTARSSGSSASSSRTGTLWPGW